jgi:hypothetical protein
LLIGPRVLPWLLRQVARTGSRELFTLGVLAVALGIAFGSAELFGEHAHRRQAEKVAAGEDLHAGRIGRPVSPVRRSNARAARSAGLTLRHAHGGAG